METFAESRIRYEEGKSAIEGSQFYERDTMRTGIPPGKILSFRLLFIASPV